MGMLYKLSGVYEYINRGYKLKFSCVTLTVLKHPSEKKMYFKPAKLMDQIKYRNVVTRLTKAGEALIAESLQKRFDFCLLNCICCINHEHKILLIKPDILFNQFLYFFSFGYLRDHFVLQDDYIILHKIMKKARRIIKL